MYNTLLQSNGFLDIDWRSFLLGSEKWNFLLEVALRSLVMFLIILTSLRILGKRSITQLSVFELGVIIGLGSAAGDPMFYKDVGLLPGTVVFIMVISLYRFMTFLINRSEKIENLLEGTPVYLLEDGKFLIKNFEKETIARDEFFAMLRQHHITHLGQLKQVILETNGAISLFFFPDKEVRWGLPVLPHLYDKANKQLKKEGQYACTHCGQVDNIISSIKKHTCPECKKDIWVEAINTLRVT